MRKLILILLLISPLTGLSDYRVWTDKKGNCIEAELLDSNPAQVSVRDKDGKVFKFHPSKLSKADQNYLRTAFPPELDISFSKVQDRENSGYSYGNVSMSGSVVIKAKRPTQYSKTMTCILIIIGEYQRTNTPIILDKVEKPFDFKTSQEFKLQGNTFRMTDDNYANNWGSEYKGFLAVVLDADNKVIELKSSRKEYEAEYAKIIKLNLGTHCNKDFTSKETTRSF